MCRKLGTIIILIITIIFMVLLRISEDKNASRRGRRTIWRRVRIKIKIKMIIRSSISISL